MTPVFGILVVDGELILSDDSSLVPWRLNIAVTSYPAKLITTTIIASVTSRSGSSSASTKRAQHSADNFMARRDLNIPGHSAQRHAAKTGLDRFKRQLTEPTLPLPIWNFLWQQVRYLERHLVRDAKRDPSRLQMIVSCFAFFWKGLTAHGNIYPSN